MLLAVCSATVYLVWCKTAQEHVAIKALNLEALNSPLEDIMQETRTMKAYRNEHLLPLYCSFVNGQQLWMVMPYMEVRGEEGLGYGEALWGRKSKGVA